MRNLSRIAMAAGSGLLLAASTAFAATGYTFDGSAGYVEPGHNSLRAVEMVSDAAAADPYGAVIFDVEDGLTFANLDTLSTDFKVTEGTCGGGSPRFSINVTDPDTNQTGNIFAYLGDAPNYTCTPDTWISSGDLLESGITIDTSQLGGTFYQSYDDAVAALGDYTVNSVSLVTDGSWLAANNGLQTVLADNVVIDETTYDFEPSAAELKESCKKGGWMAFDGSNGYGPFKNQGQCVSTFAQMQ